VVKAPRPGELLYLDGQRIRVLSRSKDIQEGLTPKNQLADDCKKMSTSRAMKAYQDLAPVIFKRSLGLYLGSTLINLILGRP
jgi:hypothetical protein